ncbi:sodium:proton antiporter, partial [Acinetobacter baumannii]
AVAGLLIGHTGTRHAMSERTRQHLLPFWSLIDETLNSILFLLIGLDVLAVEVSGPVLAAALAAVPLALAARLVSVALPMAALARWTG